MRNETLAELDPLIGVWDLTLSGAWFLDTLETEQHGRATIEWLDDAFVLMRSSLEGEPTWDLIFGRSDAVEQMYALYHDNRGVSRLFTMAFDGRRWTLSREDPDFHQRFVAEVEPDQMRGYWEASEDQGNSWRKDFDLVFERVQES
jgi:hypothetical protein